MKYRRDAASALALEYGAPKTAKVIQDPGSCWDEIFRTATHEVGIPKLAAALKKSARGEWISPALGRVKFTPTQVKILAPLVIEKCNADTTHDLFYDEPGAQKSILVAIEKKRKKTAARKILCCRMCRDDIEPGLQIRLEKLVAS